MNIYTSNRCSVIADDAAADDDKLDFNKIKVEEENYIFFLFEKKN